MAYNNYRATLLALPSDTRLLIYFMQRHHSRCYQEERICTMDSTTYHECHRRSVPELSLLLVRVLGISYPYCISSSNGLCRDIQAQSTLLNSLLARSVNHNNQLLLIHSFVYLHSNKSNALFSFFLNVTVFYSILFCSAPLSSFVSGAEQIHVVTVIVWWWWWWVL